MKRRFGWPWQPISDNPRSPRRSSLILFENMKLSGRAHTLIDQIELTGGGDYTHWGNSLFFSTTDNSDPRSNGRNYHGVLKLGIAPRVLQQLAEFGSVLVLAALGTLAWFQRRRISARLGSMTSHVRARAADYATALAVPAVVSASVFLSLPPMWNGSDSVIWLFGQWQWFPHHPPIYPAFIALAVTLFDDPEAVVRFATAIQHLVTVLAIGYLASAYRKRWQILLLSLVGTVGAAVGLYAQGLYTEGLATAFFLVFLGAMLRLHRDGSTWQVLVGLALGLFGASLTRHAYLVFLTIPLVYLGVRAIFAHKQPLLTRFRGLLVTGALVGGVALSNSLTVQYTCLIWTASVRRSPAELGFIGCRRLIRSFRKGSDRIGWLRSSTWRQRGPLRRPFL